jgi:hypothetical protein
VNKSNNNNSDNRRNPDDNLFQIIDGIISQLNKTKKMFILMILTLMILPPISFVIAFAVLGPPMFFGNGNGGGVHFGQFGHGFALVRIVPIIVFLVWLGIGIRQWFVLSKWTKKYEHYKELQRKIDEKLDYENDES